MFEEEDGVVVFVGGEEGVEGVLWCVWVECF